MAHRAVRPAGKGRLLQSRMLEFAVTEAPIQLLALDIDGTLLNPQFEISPADMDALRRAHASGIEVVVVTGRRHDFALPIVQQLGFDLWLISSNGAVTRSLSGESFYRDLLPVDTCRRLCHEMIEFRGNTVLTFDVRGKGAIVLEHLNELEGSFPSKMLLSPIPCKPCSAGLSPVCTRHWPGCATAIWPRKSPYCAPSTRCGIFRS